MNTKNLLPLSLLLIAGTACNNPQEHNVSRQDTEGNYITTSDYESMQRSDFKIAMNAGLRDYDEGVERLRERANTLGGKNLGEFSKHSETLDEKRTRFVNEMQKVEVVLESEWPDQRKRTLKAYYDLRESLNEAYEEVLEN